MFRSKGLVMVVLGGLLSAQTPSTASVFEGSKPGSGLQFVPPEELRGIPLAELPYAGFELPTTVDLSDHMPPPGHQAQQNSCAAWASAYAVKTYQEKVEQRYRLVDNGQPHWSRIFSPAFVYNQINQGRDGGATLVDALNLLRAKGALSWADMPYLSDNITQYPSSQQLQKARRFRIAYWRQVNVADVMEIKSHVHAGYPVMVGMLIDQGFYQLKQTTWDTFDGSSQSGHAVVVVGFDDRKHAFKVMNSWGKHWSEGGYGWVSYRHFRKAAREAYVAKDAWNDPPLPAAVAATQDSSERFGAVQKPAPEPQKSAEKERKRDRPASKDAPKGGGASEELALPASPSGVDRPSVEKDTLDDALRDVETGEAGEKGIWAIDKVEKTTQMLSFSGAVTFGRGLPHPEVVLHFYTVSAGQRHPFYSDTSAGTPYQLPNGQLALKAVLAAPILTSQGVTYHWQATVPRYALGASTHPVDLQAQPVLYTDKFGISKGPLIP